MCEHVHMQPAHRELSFPFSYCFSLCLSVFSFPKLEGMPPREQPVCWRQHMSSNILRYKYCSCPTGWLWEPTAVPRRFSACLAPESATQRATHTVRCCCALSSCMGFGTDLSKLRRFGISTPAAGSVRQHYTRPPSETWLSAGVFPASPRFLCVLLACTGFTYKDVH